MALFPFSFMQSQSPYDPDAAAFFARVAAAGGTLSNTEKTATNQLVLDMKSYGIWTSMKAIYPMVGASAAACAQNLVSASFTGSFTSGWTFASSGVTPNGTSAYMNTGLVPSTNGFTTSSGHISFYSRSTSVNGLYPVDFGVDQTGTGLNVSQKMTADAAYHGRAYAQVITGVDSNNIAGLHTITRTSTTLLQYNRNGSLIQTNSILELGPVPTTSLYVGATNSSGTATLFSNRECAFASLGDGLTNTQASNLYTAVQAFQTTLSRQV